MDKFLQKVVKIFLGLSMAAGVGVAIGAGRKDVSHARAAEQSVTFDLTSGGTSLRTSKTQSLIKYESGDVSFSLIKVGSATRVDNYCPGGNTNNTSQTRVYSGNSAEFAVSSDYVITKIDITATSSSYFGGLNTAANYSPAASISTSGSTTTATFASEVRASTVTANTTATGRLTGITIYYDSGSGGGGGDDPVETEGDGTFENPYTVSDCNLIMADYENNDDNGKQVYVKGIITEFDDDNGSRNYTHYDISDDTGSIYVNPAQNGSSDPESQYFLDIYYEVLLYGYLQKYQNNNCVTYLNTSSECYLVSVNPDSVDSLTASTNESSYSINHVFSETDFTVTADFIGGPQNVSITEGFEWLFDDTIVEGTNLGLVSYRNESADVSFTGTVTHATNITFPSATATVALNKTLTLTPTVTPSDASDVISWSSSLTSVATVSNGVVTPVATGSTVITATINGHSATCTVTVTAAVYEYQVVFGTADGTGGLSNFSNTSYIIPEEVTLDNIQGYCYSKNDNTAAAIRFGKGSEVGSFDASITGDYYITSVTCNLKYYGSDSTATFAVTPAGGSAISKSLTGDWADYTFDVSGAKAKKVTLGTDVNGKRAYLSGFTITYAPLITLSNITLSGTYPTAFTKGDTFSHSGMVVTANYSNSTSAVVTGSATWSSPDMSTTGVKTVTVSYSDAYGSASKTYSITVNYAAPTSITLSRNNATVSIEETFNLSTITVTINPSETADQTAFTWSLYDDGDLVEDTDYVWISPEIFSYTAGTFVFRCTSTEDGTKFAEFTLTVSGDPIAQLKDQGDNNVTGGSMSVYADAGIISYSVSTENFQGTLSYTWSSNSSSVVAVHEAADDMCDYEVKTAGSARLSCRIQGSVKGDVTVYVDVTVSAVTVTSVTWTAPTIDVFSGATLTSSDVASWGVKYGTNSGKTDQTAEVGSISVKLGGTAISLPYTWQGSDNGKTLGVEYGGVASSTTTVTITQTINAVNAPVPGELSTKTWTATAAANLGSVIASVNGTDSGEVTFDDDSTMSYERTLEYVASGKADYMAFASNYIQFGSSNALEKLVLTAATTGTVTSVVVDCWSKNGASNLTVTVGGNAFDTSKACPSAGAEVTFSGEATGTVVITMEKSTKTAGLAQYIKSVAITTQAASSGTTNIANNASHKAAQRAAVAFANAFNAAMDETENCTTGLDAAWTTCSNAYNSFKTAAAALGETEEAWAKNLVKYATAQYSDDSGEACIERMLKTYEICVQKHGKNAFMSDLVSLGAPQVSPLMNMIGENTNTVAIIVIISMVSVTAIGGYFFLRKRKENI